MSLFLNCGCLHVAHLVVAFVRKPVPSSVARPVTAPVVRLVHAIDARGPFHERIGDTCYTELPLHSRGGAANQVFASGPVCYTWKGERCPAPNVGEKGLKPGPFSTGRCQDGDPCVRRQEGLRTVDGRAWTGTRCFSHRRRVFQYNLTQGRLGPNRCGAMDGKTASHSAFEARLGSVTCPSTPVKDHTWFPKYGPEALDAQGQRATKRRFQAVLTLVGNRDP